MRSLTVRFPDDLLQKIKEAAKKNHASINQFILVAVTKEIERIDGKEELESWLADVSVYYEHYGPDDYDAMSQGEP